MGRIGLLQRSLSKKRFLWETGLRQSGNSHGIRAPKGFRCDLFFKLGFLLAGVRRVNPVGLRCRGIDSEKGRNHGEEVPGLRLFALGAKRDTGVVFPKVW